jgi:hypothetical protein
MSRRHPDRALQRAVAGLARLHPDDAEAILAALDPADKARIEALALGDDPAAAAVEPEYAYESVSPWLLARIDPEDRRAGRAGREFVLLTDAGRAALQAAAAPFRKQVSPGGPRRGRALLDQFWRFVTGAPA